MKMCCFIVSMLKEIECFGQGALFVKEASNVRWLAGLFRFFSSTPCTTSLFSIQIFSAVVQNVESMMRTLVTFVMTMTPLGWLMVANELLCYAHSIS